MKELTALASQYLPQTTTFFLIFIRIFIIIYLFPFFGSSNVPWQARSGLAGILSLFFYPMVATQAPLTNLWLIGLAIVKELLVGFTISFCIRFVFDAIQLGGEFIGYQIGFAIVNVIDPYSSNQISIIAQFKTLLAFLIFLSINGHYILIAALKKSFELLPLSTWHLNGLLVNQIIYLMGELFVIALKIAAPVLVTMILTNIALALIARTMPQINVFIVGFPLEIGLGFFILGAAMPFLGWCYKHFFMQSFKELWVCLRLIGG